MNYQKIYDDLVYNAKHRSILLNYTETHHILPKSTYPNYSNLKKYDWNAVILTAREHYIAHLLLVKIFPNDMKLTYAFNMMFSCSQNQDRYMPSSYWFEYRRKLFSKNHPCKTDCVKKKISKTLTIKHLLKNIGAKYDFKECRNCGDIIYERKKIYCSDICLYNSRENAKTSGG